MHIQRNNEVVRTSSSQTLSVRRLDSFLQNTRRIDGALGISLKEGHFRGRM